MPGPRQTGFKPATAFGIIGRDVDQPHIIEVAARQSARAMVDRAVKPVAAMVGPDQLRRVGREIAGGAIFEVEQIDALEQPLVVGEAVAADDHHGAEMAVAEQRPIFRARHAGQRDDARALAAPRRSRAAWPPGRWPRSPRLRCSPTVRVAKNSRPRTASTCAVAGPARPGSGSPAARRPSVGHQAHVGIGRAEDDAREDHERDRQHDRRESEVARQRQLAADDARRGRPAPARPASRCRTISSGREAPNRSSAISIFHSNQPRSARRGSRCARPA